MATSLRVRLPKSAAHPYLFPCPVWFYAPFPPWLPRISSQLHRPRSGFNNRALGGNELGIIGRAKILPSRVTRQR